MSAPIKTILSCLLLGVSAALFGQTGERPQVEIVESVPVETVLGASGVRRTQEVWLEMIKGAASSLDIAEFYVSNAKEEPLDDVIRAILAAGKRGVAVRIIADAKLHKTYPETVDLLGQKKNITTRVIDYGRLDGGIHHAKYFIVDGHEIFLGSQNFDWRSLKHIHEVGLRIRQDDLVKFYGDIFDLDWKLAEWNDPRRIPALLTSRSYNFPVPVITGGQDTAWLTPSASPGNLLPDSALWDEPVIIGLLDNARKEVWLQFLSYSTHVRDGADYVALDNAIRRAAARGVKIRLIVADWGKGAPADVPLKKLSDFPNIEVKFSAIPDASEGYIPFARVEHCKYICADESAFWVGSANAEKGYFYTTRNVGISGKSTPLTRTLKEIFLKSWDGPYTQSVRADSTYPRRQHGEAR
jgi:phosphatidylserine/phosphatidylglycerophosphate/cardiolipin synthase-like enzyme